MAANKPQSLTVRTYDVGFGDCFLLTFHYAKRNRHVLIDFGSMELPQGKRENGKKIAGRYLNRIAAQIAEDCDHQLDVVVATHRHQDHISGFARSDGQGPGEIIRALNPRLVIQPWTEDPDAAIDATEPTRSLHVRTLAQMQAMAEQLATTAKSLRGQRFKDARTELTAIGLDNIKNRDAVSNLQTMAPNRYVHFGRAAGLGRILPGVKVTVLGPPTVKQTNTILSQRSRDPDEFWHLNADFWRRLAVTAERHGTGAAPLFPKHAAGVLPRSAGWFKYTVMRERADSLLSIVRALDDAMNNTSVILLFEVNGKSVLFPGDAQYENWMYALSRDNVVKALAAVDLYKVGHHGSLNATPRTLWNAFKQKGPASQPGRLQSLLSTRGGVHGSPDRKTEVPRRSLVNALKDSSSLISTEEYGPEQLSRPVTLEL